MSDARNKKIHNMKLEEIHKRIEVIEIDLQMLRSKESLGKGLENYKNQIQKELSELKCKKKELKATLSTKVMASDSETSDSDDKNVKSASYTDKCVEATSHGFNHILLNENARRAFKDSSLFNNPLLQELAQTVELDKLNEAFSELVEYKSAQMNKKMF